MLVLGVQLPEVGDPDHVVEGGRRSLKRLSRGQVVAGAEVASGSVQVVQVVQAVELVIIEMLTSFV